MVTAGGKVVFGKYAQVTNNPENDGCINAVLRASSAARRARARADGVLQWFDFARRGHRLTILGIVVSIICSCSAKPACSWDHIRSGPDRRAREDQVGMWARPSAALSKAPAAETIISRLSRISLWQSTESGEYLHPAPVQPDKSAASPSAAQPCWPPAKGSRSLHMAVLAVPSHRPPSSAHPARPRRRTTIPRCRTRRKSSSSAAAPAVRLPAPRSRARPLFCD
jgi:hypothetical protein